MHGVGVDRVDEFGRGEDKKILNSFFGHFAFSCFKWNIFVFLKSYETQFTNFSNFSLFYCSFIFIYLKRKANQNR